MLKNDALIVYQIRAKRPELIEGAIDNLRGIHGLSNIAVSRIHQSADGSCLLAFVSVYRLGPKREPKVSEWRDPSKYAMNKEAAQR